MIFSIKNYSLNKIGQTWQLSLELSNSKIINYSGFPWNGHFWFCWFQNIHSSITWNLCALTFKFVVKLKNEIQKQ